MQVPVAHDLYMIRHLKGSVDSDHDCVSYDVVCTLVTTVQEEHAALEDGNLMMKAVCSFEMLATTCHQVPYRYDPETQNLKVRDWFILSEV